MAKRKLSRTDPRSGSDTGRRSGKSNTKKSGPYKPSGEGRGERPSRSFSDKPFEKRKSSSRFGADSNERPKRNFSRGDAPSGERRSERPFDKKRPFTREGGEKKFSRAFNADSKPRRAFPDGFKRDDRNEERPKRNYRLTDGENRRGGFKKDSDRPFDKKRSFDDRGDKPKRPFSDERPRGNAERPFGKKSFDRNDRPKRSFSGDKDERPKRNYRKDNGAGDTQPHRERPFDRDSRPTSSFTRNSDDSPKRPFTKAADTDDTSAHNENPFLRKRTYSKDEDEKPRKRTSSAEEDYAELKDEKPFARKRSVERAPNEDIRERRPRKSFADSKPGPTKGFFKREDEPAPTQIRLNRYLANSGVSSRREADEFIKMGLVTVNGKTITEMGYQVQPGDVVKHEGKMLRAEKPVYILMNKPKGFLTTTRDPEDRHTVLHIIGSAVKERIYPVGRLDRNTTGLLLLTNDGALTEQLSHPSYNVKKIYKVELDRPLAKVDFEKIGQGVQLEEGRAMVDDIAIVSDDGKTVGLEIHIGWNRVVRRIFESLEYTVVKLDRTIYAGLDKKDLSRGQWRFLKEEEVIRLKHLKKGTK